MTWAWDSEKKSESPTGIKPMTSQTLGGCLTTERQELIESEAILLSSYVTHILDTARIFERSCMGLIPVRNSGCFLCPTLVSLLINSSLTFNSPSWKFTITFIYHNWQDDMDIVDPSSMQDAIKTDIKIALLFMVSSSSIDRAPA